MAFPTDRETLSLRELYDGANYGDVMDFERFDELLTHVAQEVELPAGKLRITDRFDQELKPDWLHAWDSGLAMLAFDVEDGLKRHKRKGEKVNLWTVDDYLRLMNELY
ncbi:hypothetical protein [Luteibacter sp.]|uniref:hypothetical protein n=1 Tax=Luteibacter sp. TaxID=1886636 RepID=UPI003F81B2BE